MAIQILITFWSYKFHVNSLKSNFNWAAGNQSFQIRMLSIFRRTWHFRIFSGDIKGAYLVTCLLLVRQMGQKSQWHLWNRPIKSDHHQHCAWVCRRNSWIQLSNIYFFRISIYIETKFRPGIHILLSRMRFSRVKSTLWELKTSISWLWSKIAGYWFTLDTIEFKLEWI